MSERVTNPPHPRPEVEDMPRGVAEADAFFGIFEMARVSRSYPLATLTGEQLTALIREARRGVPPYVPSEDAQPTRLTLDEP